MKGKFMTLIRLLILIFTMTLIIGLKENQIPSALLLILILFLNVQVRGVFLKNRLFFVSLLLDIIIVYFLQEKYGGIAPLPLLITVFDGIILQQTYDIPLTLLIGMGILYSNLGKSLDLQLISGFSFLLTVTFAFQVRNLGRKITELEEVYDHVRKYSYELEVAKNQIAVYSQQVEHLTSIKERQRISEEIHDTIGHRLTALLMQLEAGVRLIEQDVDHGKGFIRAGVENLRESIEVLRQTVRRTMPKEYKNLMISLEELTKKFSKDTGINLQLEVEGEIKKLYPGVEMVIYKNTQEAITNAVRHGGATSISISLIYEENRVILEVKDNGKGCGVIKKGVGLNSMEERLKFVGGYLEIEKETGFLNRSIFPLGKEISL